MRKSTRVARVFLVAAAIATVGVAPTVVAAPAGAVTPGAQTATAPSSGCSGQATSYDSKGKIIDQAVAPGKGGTSSDPLRVDLDGSVSWKGSTTAVLQNAKYDVTASGFTVKSGTFKNAKGNQSWTGVENIKKRLDAIPVLGWATKTLNPTVTVKVDYSVTAPTGQCTGSVVLKIGDSPTFTPLWFGSIALFGLGLFMLFWPAKTAVGGVI